MTDLIARHLQKTYKGRTVVSDLSLSVGAGEIVGLLGPNGAGKSTLLKTIVGLTRPNSGTVVTLGTNITEPSTKHAIKELRQKIGFDKRPILMMGIGFKDESRNRREHHKTREMMGRRIKEPIEVIITR